MINERMKNLAGIKITEVRTPKLKTTGRRRVLDKIWKLLPKNKKDVDDGKRMVVTISHGKSRIFEPLDRQTDGWVRQQYKLLIKVRH